MGNFCLQNHRWKTASPYGQFQKLSVAQALSLTLRKPAQSICMLFIVKLKNWWLIIYVLLLCLSTEQPAEGLSTPTSQVWSNSGRPRAGWPQGLQSKHTQWLLSNKESVIHVYLLSWNKQSSKANLPTLHFSLEEQTWIYRKRNCTLRICFIFLFEWLLAPLPLDPYTESQFPIREETLGV